MFNKKMNEAGTVLRETDLYIDSLPPSFSADDFAQLFAGFKTTSLNFKKHKTGNQTGYGFVTMETKEEAQRAITELNGKPFDGECIRVQPSARNEVSTTNLYIEGLPEEW